MSISSILLKRHNMHDMILKEAVRLRRYKTFADLRRTTRLSYFLLTNAMKRCALKYSDVFYTRADIGYFDKIMKVLPEVSSLSDLASSCGVSVRYINYVVDSINIRSELQVYFRLKRINKKFSLIGLSPFKESLMKSKSFMKLISDVRDRYLVYLDLQGQI